MNNPIIEGITVAIMLIGMAVLIHAILSAGRDVLKIRRGKKKGRRKKLTAKKLDFQKLAEVFSRPVPGRDFAGKSPAELASKVGISIREVSQAMDALGSAAKLTEKSVRSLGEGLAKATLN